MEDRETRSKLLYDRVALFIVFNTQPIMQPKTALK